MNFLELFFIAIGLSMDAFAVSICIGLTMPTATVKKSLIVGAYFGIFQFIMPLLGYMLAVGFADKISAFDHWVAFILLALIGGKMVFESFKKDDDDCGTDEKSLDLKTMLPLALATSIDALAVGVSFAFLKVNIAPSALFIGVTTFILSMIGVKIGKVFGDKFKSNAELAGGIILILIGLKILIEHLGVIKGYSA